MAVTDYERGGKDVLVRYIPTDEDYETAKRVALNELKGKCAIQRALLLPHHYKSTIISFSQRDRWNSHLEAKEFVTSFCTPPKVSVDISAMGRRDNRYKRQCEEERETNQFICEE